jgi:hypothetical protein
VLSSRPQHLLLRTHLTNRIWTAFQLFGALSTLQSLSGTALTSPRWAVNRRTTPTAAKKTVPVRRSPPSEHDRLRILPSLSARLCQEDPNRATGPIHYHLLQLRATRTLPLLCIDRRSDRIHTLNLPRLRTTNRERGPRVILRTWLCAARVRVCH